MTLVKKLLSSIIIISSAALFANPWNDGIEIGTSVAHSYGSRSLFINPAAIAYENELNGTALLNSFTYGSTFNHQSEFSLSSSYGYFGFGYERLSQDNQPFSRYQLGLSYGISPELFWGTRFSTTTSDISSLSGNFSWDVGFQYRPSSFISLGLLVTEINQSTINGITSPINYNFAIVMRPLSWLTLSSDVETPSDKFFKNWGYQTTLAIEPIRGLSFNSGFQKDHRFQVGLQLDLNRASLFSVVNPSPKTAIRNTSTSYTLGFQTAAKPFATVLNQSEELRIVLDESLSEEGRENSFLVKGKPSLLEVLDSISKAGRNPIIHTINVQLKSFPLGLGAAEELTDVLFKAREQGKTVNVFLSSAKTKEYLIASAATNIYLEPSGDIALLGPRIGKYFAKGTLDKIGIEGEFLARGEYKSAPETFTRKESTLQSKEATQHELKQIEKGLLSIFQKTRNITNSQWEKLLKYAVFSSTDALREKLIDKIGSFNDFNSQKASGTYFDQSTSFASKSLNLPNRIAIITLDGGIMESRNRLLSVTGQSQVTPKSVEPLIRKAVSDNRTKAIVLRVSSPGGEVLASEQIASLIAEAKSKKPLIVSMGDVAASGGYYISAPANTIFANNLTLTGSIGVFLGKFNLAKLFSKIDLKKEIIGTGPYFAIDSEHKAWTPDEKAIMNRRLNQFYESFVNYVARSRNISTETAEKAAKGRVWLGNESVELKIVDRVGGMMDAIETAKEKTGLSTEFVIYPVRESVSMFDAISEETFPFALSEIQTELSKLYWIQKQSFLFLSNEVDVF